MILRLSLGLAIPFLSNHGLFFLRAWFERETAQSSSGSRAVKGCPREGVDSKKICPLRTCSSSKNWQLIAMNLLYLLILPAAHLKVICESLYRTEHLLQGTQLAYLAVLQHLLIPLNIGIAPSMFSHKLSFPYTITVSKVV